VKEAIAEVSAFSTAVKADIVESAIEVSLAPPAGWIDETVADLR
jgi:hypothetical protein